MVTAYIDTPIGTAEISGGQNGISAIHILDMPKTATAKIPAELEVAVTQLNEYFAAARTSFDFPIDPHGSAFQLKVWRELLKIPYGKTVSYTEVAKNLGDVKAIRAVASANGKNPLWIVVPCHRVIGADGSLTGYAGGLWRKEWLLEHENPPSQQRLF